MNMVKNTRFDYWNLRDIITFIFGKSSDITEIYLFGSRAYNTGSLRSDIDLLIISNMDIPDVPFRDEIYNKFPPVDLFISLNLKSARSMMNGSVLRLRDSYSTIIEQVDAVLLWKKNQGFNESFNKWTQTTQKGINFIMSIIPSYPFENIGETVKKVIQNLSNSGIESFFTGTDCMEIANNIIELIRITFTKPNRYAAKADKFSYDKIKISSEYDFQNLIQMILRPIFRSIEPEPMEIFIDGNRKFADFSVSKNKVVIEAKYIDSNSKKSEVLKTLDGLANFYSENPNIRALVFLILYEKTVDLDPILLKTRYTDEYKDIPIYTEFIKNIF